MALFIVTNNNDSGAGSLRDALAQANANADADTIRFANTLSGDTIHLQSGLQITQGTVTIDGDIDGDGDPDIIISGDSDESGTLDSNDVAQLLVLYGATTDVTLNSLHLSDAYSTGSQSSAGIRLYTQSNINIIDSILSNFIAKSSSAFGDVSAAVSGINFQGYNYTTATISDTVLTGIVAVGGDGAAGVNSGHAGNGIAGIKADDANVTLNRVGLFDSSGHGGDGATPSGGGGNVVVGITGLGGPIGGPPNPSVVQGTFGYRNLTLDPGNNFGGGTGSQSIIPATGAYMDVDGLNIIAEGNLGTTGADGATVASGGRFYGFHGDDIVDNSAGYGRLYGGSGNDTITTMGNGARAYGGSGNDTIINLFSLNAVMDGGEGNDTLDLSDDFGSVTFNMVAGTMSGGFGTAANFENFIGVDDVDFVDNVFGTEGANDIRGMAGNDILHGLGGADIILGGDGDDTIEGGKGADNLFGGIGADAIDGGGGGDVLSGEGGADTLNGRGGGDQLFGGGAGDALFGQNGEDMLSGGAGADELDGGRHNDTLFGGKGEDVLDGGKGADDMIGGNQDDRYIVDHKNDQVDERGTAGRDTVEATVSFNLSNANQALGQVEVLNLKGGADIDGTGNGLFNQISGNGGDNRLDGRGGDDSITGGKGNDRIKGGTGVDILEGGGGRDIFVFSSKNESGTTGKTRDKILDFDIIGNDKMDLSGFKGTLTFVGTAGLSGKNQVSVSELNKFVLVEVSTDNDADAEFSIFLKNTVLGDMNRADFIL